MNDCPTPGVRRRAARPTTPASPPPRSWRPALLALALLASGCASLQPEAGLDAVVQRVQPHLPAGSSLRWQRSEADENAIAQRVAELLGQPLGMDAAVHLALLNNPGLQAGFESLGIADADRVQASRLPNPGFSIARLHRGDETEWERGVHLNLASLLTLPMSARLGERQATQAQAEVASQVLALAADTRSAWVDAVAAQQSLVYSRQVMAAAEASAELARRMAQVGNFSALQQAREQSFYADAALAAARAQQAGVATRERLTRLLGLWGAQTTYTLPERLPDLPAAPQEGADLERLALAQRGDVRAAVALSEQRAEQLGGIRSNRLVNALEIGAVSNSSNEAPTQRGVELSLELPLFDDGQARVARAEHLHRQSLHQAAQAAITARSEVREAYAGYRTAWDIARHHRDEIVPLRTRIAEENLLRYNGMLIGVFELLADARLQIGSVQAAIDALREFWQAQIRLDQALIGPTANPTSPASQAGRATAPADSAAGH